MSLRVSCHDAALCVDAHDDWHVAAGRLSLPFFPSEAVFAVVRDGHRIGFRSIG